MLGTLLMMTPGSNDQQTVQLGCERRGLLPVANSNVARLANSATSL